MELPILPASQYTFKAISILGSMLFKFTFHSATLRYYHYHYYKRLSTATYEFQNNFQLNFVTYKNQYAPEQAHNLPSYAILILHSK